MPAIMGVSIQSSVSQPSTLQVTLRDDGTKASEDDASIDVSGLVVSGQAKAKAAEGSGDSEPPHIKQLRELIKRLQEQLAEQQKQLSELMARKMDETTKTSLVAAKQAGIASLHGQILVVAGQLLEALTEIQGSSAGGMVNTQA